MSWIADLAHGLAEQLAAAGIAHLPAPPAPTPTPRPALVVGIMPAAPPRVVVLSVYALADDIDQADSRIGLQVRVRGAGPDPREALDLIDAAFDELHGASHLTLAGTAATSTPTPITCSRTGRALSEDRHRYGASMGTQQVSIWVPIVVGVIGGIGIVSGQLINAWREDRRWRREQEREELRWQREIEKHNDARADSNRAHWRDKRFELYTDFLSYIKRWYKYILKAEGSVRAGESIDRGVRSKLVELDDGAIDQLDRLALIMTDRTGLNEIAECVDNYSFHTHQLWAGNLKSEVEPAGIIDFIIARMRIDLGIEQRTEH